MKRTCFPAKCHNEYQHKARQAAEQREERKVNWLNNNTIFNQSFLLSEDQKIAAEIVFKLLAIDGYKFEQKYLDFEILLANLLSQRTKPVAISRNINDWSKSRYRYTSYFMVKLVKIMKMNGLIEMENGYYDHDPKKESRVTRIWPTSLLLDYFPLIPHGITIKPKELVELQDEKHQLIEYKDTSETIRIRKILQLANEVNKKAKILYNGDHVSASLIAIFKQKFTLYGRLHTRGFRHYQGMSGDEREELTINGDPVVELDYSGLHPRILYAKEGIQYNNDPYTEVDDKATSGIVRSLLKEALLCMLNSKDKVAAERAVNKWINIEYVKTAELKERLEKGKITKEYFNERKVVLKQRYTDRRQLKREGNIKARPIIDAFKKAHEPIAHHFCNGKETGLRTMNLDSKIALDIVKYFTKQGKPILAVHDSFIVQQQYRDELLKVMDKTYQKHTGGFHCPIK